MKPSLRHQDYDMKDPEAIDFDPFGVEHVMLPMVEYRCPGREWKARMYEVGPLRLTDFIDMLRYDGYAMFRRFEAMQIRRMTKYSTETRRGRRRSTISGEIASGR